MSWEMIIDESGITSAANSTMRLAVPGGWIYRWNGQLVFVPTPVAQPAP